VSSISEPFIRRPVATTLLMVALTLVGLVALRALPVSALPQVDYPTIVVATNLPGASAETMASSVTTPLERQFGQMPSLSQMTSVSSLGNSQITLQFNLDRNIDAAQQDVQAAINAASNLLPRTLPTPPTYSKSNPADAPILTLSVSSDTLPLSVVDDQADSILAQKISQVSGVGLVTLNGGQKPAVRVQIDPEALAGANLTVEDVRTAIVAANVNQPKGSIDGVRQNFALATNDQLFGARAVAPTVIAYRNGAPIRIAQIADVIDGVENAQLAGWSQGQRAIILNVQRQPGANVIDVADRVKALLPKLKSSLPQGLDVTIVSDRTQTIRASVADVGFTLVLTIGLVIAVVFVFLRELRATLIPGVTVPLSLIGTFAVMSILGYSLNNLSLMALTISTGFVIDDAIVMIENISRHVERGMHPFEAALEGSRQIGFTIISLTVSLIAVLIPLLFMGGIIGRLFREFAVTLSIAVAISAILSLTLTATMCAHWLKERSEHASSSRIANALERGFDAMLGFYRAGLDWVLSHQVTTLIATVSTLIVTLALAVLIPKGFFPQQDTGLLLGVTEARADVSFQKMMGLQQAAAKIIQADPAVDVVTSFIGVDGSNATLNNGRLSIALRPEQQRDASADAIIQRLQRQVARIDGLSVHLQAVQDFSVDNRISSTQYQFTLESADAAALATFAPKLLERLRQLPELADVASDQHIDGKQIVLNVDRDAASRLGVSIQAIDDTLYDAFGQRQITTVFTQLNLYRMILEVKPGFATNPDSLGQLYVRTQNGDPVPLNSVVQMDVQPAAVAISHQGQFPAATLSFNVASGYSLGHAVEAIERAEAALAIPPSIRAEFQGTARAFQESLANESTLILAALITVYIVLGILYESTIHPITILSTLPSAGVGALLALMLCKTEFSIIALIGIILLIGIVKKNAIMMIDFALDAERGEGLPPLEAIRQACLLRFRPIMMTTAAALFGGVPLAFGSGTGSELRRPLGISIVGGLLISQILTLYTTPVVYLMMGRIAKKLKGSSSSQAAREPAPAEL
jgi:multidrug efflux pump